MKEQHGSTGNKNAAKPDGEKQAAETLTLGVPYGWLGNLKVALPGRARSETIRRWIREGAKREGVAL